MLSIPSSRNPFVLSLFLSLFLFRWNEKTGHGQMMDVESSYSDFINCDRTGRRNAVPDIKGEEKAAGTSELTKDMAQMDLKAGGRYVSDNEVHSC